MNQALGAHALDQLFIKARNRNGWSSEPVSRADVRVRQRRPRRGLFGRDQDKVELHLLDREGADEGLFERLPRLGFEAANQII